MKTVSILVKATVPDSATDKDVDDYFSYEIGRFGSYLSSNPLANCYDVEIVDVELVETIKE